ncbi:MAG: GntR family transcriptional regulator, partial [Oscillospiraceae bacterium]
MKLDDQLAMPLYKQLVMDLSKRIQSGDLVEGSRLPPEQEISEIYGVSRITVRTALKELAKENLIISKQGKGTFVGKKKMARDLSLATSFTQACLEMGRSPGAKVIRMGLETPNDDDVRQLNIPYSSKVVVLERLRFADGEPISLEFDRFPESYSFLLNENMDDVSLLALLKEKYSIEFVNVHRTIELVYASQEIGKLLNLRSGYPLLFVTGVGQQASSGVPGQRSLQYIIG